MNYSKQKNLVRFLDMKQKIAKLKLSKTVLMYMKLIVVVKMYVKEKIKIIMPWIVQKIHY